MPAPTPAPRRAPAALTVLLALAACAGPERMDPETQLEIYRETANVYYVTGELERAESQALKGLELRRRDVPLRLMLGWIALRRDDTQSLLRAQKIFDEILDDDPKNTQAHLGIGEAQERLGVVSSRSADAIERGDRLPRRGTPGQRVLELRADANRYWRQAIGHYERTLAERRTSFKALNGLQRTWSLLGEWEKSLGYAEQLIALSRAESEDFQRLLASGRLSAQQEQELRTSEQRGRTLRIDTHMLAADLLVALERPDEAVAHLDAALELDPERVDALGRRGELRHRLGDHGGAIADIDAFLRLSTSLPYEHPDVRKAYDLRAAAEAARRPES